MSGEEEVDDGAAKVAVETEARRNGWAPKEQWRGDPDQWIDADEFQRRGQNILPIVNANNRRLLGELETARKELNGMKGRLTQQEQTVKDLLEHQAAEVERQVNSKLADLRRDKKAAIKDGDHDLAADLDEQIDATKDALAEASKPKPAPRQEQQTATTPEMEPWVKEFSEKNADWLEVDQDKTGLFLGICDRLYKTTQLRGTALLEEGKKQAEEKLNPRVQRMAKSEGGGGGWEGGSGGGTPGGMSYNDLPADAKAVCNAQEKKFVGEGKAFKTQGDWRKHYAETVLGAAKR